MFFFNLSIYVFIYAYDIISSHFGHILYCKKCCIFDTKIQRFFSFWKTSLRVAEEKLLLQLRLLAAQGHILGRFLFLVLGRATLVICISLFLLCLHLCWPLFSNMFEASRTYRPSVSLCACLCVLLLL